MPTATASASATPSPTPTPTPPPLIAVFAAFPAELAALLEHTEVDHAVELNGLDFRVGTLGGVPVVVGMTGIGLVNATATSSAVLDAFAFDAAVFSGVAGSPMRIGDVVVPVRWELRDGSGYDADPDLLDVARRVATRTDLPFDQCTEIPNRPTQEVCVVHEPVLAVGGIGRSDDSFNGTALRCMPGRGDVFGCDPDEPPLTPVRASEATTAGVEPEPMAVDQETAAVAREAAARGIPFIGFRGVSDGAGDPLNLPGFPAQFFVYYRLAARNAAVAVDAFFDELRQPR
jgi:nucleoside phosphorylase